MKSGMTKRGGRAAVGRQGVGNVIFDWMEIEGCSFWVEFMA